MMDKINVNHILTITSAVIGHFLMLAACILANRIDGVSKECHNIPGAKCAPADGTTAAAAFGIIAALIQIGFCYYAVMKKEGDLVRKLWMPMHIGLLILNIIAFSLGVQYTKDARTTATEFFNSVTGIDWIFCLFASIAYFFFGQENAPSLPS